MAPIRLVRPLSSGPDGVSYLGIDERDEQSITVDRLFLARRDTRRWAELDHRIRLLLEHEHPHVLRIRHFCDDDDAYLVTERPERTIGDAQPQALVRSMSEIAGALAHGHALGLAHGALGPARVLLADDGRALIDLSGVRTGGRGRVGALDAADAAPAEDVAALARLVVYLRTGTLDRAALGGNERLAGLLGEMLDPDPTLRPSMHEVLQRLRRVESTGAETTGAHGRERTALLALEDVRTEQQVGRFRLLELLGEGAMGRVYRAEDVAGGAPVALKLLRPEWARDREALRRFYREARVLSELDNPHIARFIEVNEDRGIHYLAMEYVQGQSLAARIEERGALSVAEALDCVRDVALALADVHDLGVVHRDVKPANILLVRGDDPLGRRRGKLCDFGIARRVASSNAEELTEVGTAVGTPHYMAPEQCVGGEIDARSDIYAIGITLFKMLVGQVPFNATDARAIVYKHLTEPVPDLRTLCPSLGDEEAALVARMLAKDPNERFQDARELLEAVERVRRGAPACMEMHPRPPASNGDAPLAWDFCWDLVASPAALWPHVSHTERLNRAIGLDAIEFRRERRDGRVETYGKLRMSGMTLDWREHAYEWVAPQRMGVLREFSAGPFVWLRSTVELAAHGAGTRLTHRIEVEPRGVLGRAAAGVEIGFKARRNLERVYRRIDRFASGKQELPPASGILTGLWRSEETLLDPFEPPRALDEAQLARIARGHERLVELGIDEEVAARLSAFLRWAPEQEIARIRPRAFARRFTLDHREVLRACLYAAQSGLLVMLWDVICPRCQIPSSIEESMRALGDHSHCDACDLDFELDFGRSVEIVFRAHPEVRASELRTYCIGGPGHTPHVIAQILLAAGERFEMDLSLEEGSYRIAGRELPMAWDLSVRHDAPARRWELSLRHGLSPGAPRILGAGRQELVLVSDLERDVLVRVERTSGREDAVSAAEVACMAAFRELFPHEALAPGHLVSISKVALLVVELAGAWSGGADEAAVFGRLNELKRLAGELAGQEGGALVKLHGDGVMLSFTDALGAVRTAAALFERLAKIRVALHGGAALATSINDRLDYFGRVVRELGALIAAASDGKLLASEAVCADPAVAAWLADRVDIPEVVFVAGIVAQALSPREEPRSQTA